MIRKILYIVIVVIAVLGIFYRDLIGYAYMQAKGQFHILRYAQPVETFLSDNTFPDSLKTKIRLIQTIRKYAIDSLGLNDSENYTSLYDQQGKDILWNLSAVEPYAMEPKTWTFPFLGSFPYKGFFDLEKAKLERDRLIEQGYDTRLRSVGGWSTLGWFKDPILSNMLSRNEGRLADLIIHELTHATLFVKDSVEFNENLAMFIGKKGAEKFLKDRYGADSEELKAYLQHFKDTRNYYNHMLRGYEKLDSLYHTFEKRFIEDTNKELLKQDVIKEIVMSLDTISFSKPERLKKIFEEQLPNNAYFMSFKRYGAKQNLFLDEYLNNFGGDIKSFITYYKVKYPSL